MIHDLPPLLYCPKWSLSKILSCPSRAVIILQSMEATKALLRHTLRAKLEAALDSEVPLLVQHWISTECQTNFRRFLDDEDIGLQRQRLDP